MKDREEWRRVDAGSGGGEWKVWLRNPFAKGGGAIQRQDRGVCECLNESARARMSLCVCICNVWTSFLQSHTHLLTLFFFIAVRIFLLLYAWNTERNRTTIRRQVPERDECSTHISTFLAVLLLVRLLCECVCVEKSQISRPLWQNYYSRTR